VPSILKKCTRDDAVVVAQSFSKSYCMTGWRLGWLVARADVAARAAQLNEFIISHAASFTQRAAETALLWGDDTVREMVTRSRRIATSAWRRSARFPALPCRNPPARSTCSAHRRPEGLVRFLPPPADGDARGTRAGRRLRQRRRRIGAHLLRRGTADRGGGDGSPARVSSLIVEAASSLLIRTTRRDYQCAPG